MSLWLQNLIVFAIVAACAAIALWQIIGSIRSGKGKCCAHGCGTEPKPDSSTSEKILFLPADSLRRRAKR